MNIYRGDIYYVYKSGQNIGVEQDAGRPAVVVSNEKCNEHAHFVEVVYLTTQDKKPLPTHVDVLCKTPSIALCEQVHSVSKDRLGEFIRSCTPAEMDEIDMALMVSLDLDCYLKDDQPALQNDGELKKLKEKLEAKQREIDELSMKNDEIYAELCKEKNKSEETSDSIKIAIERDLYKQQYDDLLERVIAR